MVAILLIVAVAIFGLLALLTNIFERKREAQNPFFRVVELSDETEDPAVWGKNFPFQYDGYLKTVDMQRTTFGGSEAIPRAPSEEDPRTATSRQKLERIPQLVRMWAGYAFAVDYREKRGHAHMLEDQIYTQRQRVIQQPGTCMQCHASVYLPMKRLGDGDVLVGFEHLNQMNYQDAVKNVEHPIVCLDCHDSQTMALRITRPAFVEGIRAYKASQGIENYDVATMATRQEMRSYVCGQCHVEYYFGGEKKRLIFPWSKGLTVDDEYAYFEEIGFADWTHAETGGKMLKAQHPEFEMWSQGVHSRSGVACADCHMPYMRVGAMKISDHHVRSPLLNINNACQTCHSRSEQALLAQAEEIQARHAGLTEVALDALVDLIDDIAGAKGDGVTDEQLAEALGFQRRASFYVDWVDAENSTGFHAPQEAARVLGMSIDFSRRGQIALRDALGAG
ncbi:MAG: ammonia-forming cytochrome c nitrite reductase subunit c552 [Myxococcota bacterium]